MAKMHRLFARIEKYIYEALAEEAAEKDESAAWVVRNILKERYWNQKSPGFFHTRVAEKTEFSLKKARNASTSPATPRHGDSPVVAEEFLVPDHLSPVPAGATHPTKQAVGRGTSRPRGKASKK